MLYIMFVNCSEKYRCHLSHPYYIRMTTNTLRNRLQQHNYYGSIKDHLTLDHPYNYKNRYTLLKNSLIISKNVDNSLLSIYEVLYILTYTPLINQQTDYFARQLNLFSSIPTNETLNLDRYIVPKNKVIMMSIAAYFI